MSNVDPSDKDKDKEKDEVKSSPRDQSDTNRKAAARKFVINEEQKPKFNRFCEKYLAIGVRALCKEWEENIKHYGPPDMQCKAFHANPDKNRYRDMVCLDATRVVLEGPGGDYIHANRVEGPPLLNKFICTQGPLENTIADFWRMVVQNKVKHIYMLCECIEHGKKKCEQYWPEKENESAEYGSIKVENIKTTFLKGNFKENEGITREIRITAPGNVVKLVKHNIWRSWPDKSVPGSRLACLRLLKTIRQSSGTTVIHCSAGVGRTGTFIAIEMVYMDLMSKPEEDTNLIDLVRKLRGMRMTAVQTDLQYAYIVLAMAYFAKQNKWLNDKNTELLNAYKNDFDKISMERSVKK